MSQQALTGNYRYQGVPATSVAWTDHGATPTARTASIFTEISKSAGAGIDYEQAGNTGELTGLVTGRRFIDLSFSAIPVGASDTAAAALLVAEGMPLINDELTITCASDTQVAGVCYCKSAQVRYTPDGDAVLDITARKYITLSNGVASTVDLGAVS